MSVERVEIDPSSQAVATAIVVAAAANNVIGDNNRLPWRLPADLKHFKTITMGYPLVMGRKTYQSIGRPLPGRFIIVVTRQKSWTAEGVSIAHSLTRAMELAVEYAVQNQLAEIMVAGGADIYEQVLPLCQKIYLTEVQAMVPGDAYFPVLNAREWREINREDHRDREGHSHNFSFVTKQRINEVNKV